MPTYDFTGLADGAPWPSPFQNYTTYGKGVASVQNQAGEMKSGALGNYNWQDQCRVNYQTTPANVEVVYTMTIANTDCVPNLIMRNAGNSGDSEAQRMEIKHDGSTVRIQESGNNDLTQIGTVAFNAFAQPTKVRCQVNGMAFKIKLWAASAAEPAAWSSELTLTKVGAAGSFGYFLVGGAAAVNRTVSYDNILVQDLAGFTRTVTLTAPASVSGTVGTAISAAALTATVNDQTSVTYSGTSLPPGVSVNATTGAITGTPTAAGTYTTTFTAAGATGATNSKTTTFTIGSGASVTLTAPATATGRVSVPITGFTLTSSVTGGGTVTYSASNLPPGISLNSTTGAVSGTPTTVGTPTTTFTATNSAGPTDSKTTAWTISAAPTVTLTAPASVTGRVGTAISGAGVSASTNDGGTVTYSVTGLPPGLSLNTSTGAVTGTPTTVGSYTATYTATSSSGPTDTKSTSFTINPAPTVTLTAPATATGRVNTTFTSFSLSSSTNDSATVTYSSTGRPPGLSLNSTTGAVTGTPTTAGSYTTTWTATSSTGATDTKQTAFTINPAPTVTLTAPATVNGAVGSPVNVQVTGSTNDGAAITYSASTLPPGLTLNSSTGQVTGTPTTVGSTTTVWTATSASGPTATANTSWSISAPVYNPPVRRWTAPRTGWQYIATTVRGDGTESLLAASLPLTGVSLVDPVSAAPELSFDLTPEIRRLQRPDGRPLIRARSTAVYAILDGVIRGGGIVSRTNADGESLKVLCSGFVSLIDGEPWTNSTIKYVGVDPADVIRTIWRYWQMHPLANIPLQIPADLRTGAKVGTTAEPVLLANYATADLGELFFDMLEAGAIDFRERHWWVDDDTIGHRLDMGSPRLGRRRTDISFRVGTNVLVPSVGFDQERYASEVLVLGAGEGDKMIRAHAYNPNADRIRRCKALPSKGIGRTPTAQLFANKWVQNFMGDERDVEELVVLNHPVAPLFSWDPGDEVWLSGDSMWGGQIGMWVRILSTTVTPDKSATALLKVARADKVI